MAFFACAHIEKDIQLDSANFFDLFFENGLTRRGFGCILYDVGSEKDRCSLQNRRSGDEKAARRSGTGSKKNRKIFGNGFDKAQKCAIVYITRLIRSWNLRMAGVIIERAHGMDGVEECRGSVLLKGVRGTKPGNF